MLEKYKNKNILFNGYVIAFCIVLIPRILISLFAMPLTDIADEVASLSSAAFAAGYDWSHVVSKVGYYGFGYFIIFAPLIEFLESPIAIYRIILCISGIVQSMSAVICYHILKKYLGIADKRLRILFAVLCSYMNVTYNSTIINENIYILLNWLIALIIIKLVSTLDYRGKKNFWSVCLAIVLSYTLTIHTRAITIFIAICISFIIFYIVYKKRIVSWFFFAVFGIGYCFSKMLINFFQENIWLSDAENLRNASIDIPQNIKLLDSTTWSGFLKIILGEINTLVIFSGGLIIIFLIIAIREIVMLLKNRKIHIDSNRNQYLLVISIIFFLCIAATILAQGVTWLPGVIEGLKEEKVNYSFKAFTYLRYFMPYIGPAFMCMLVWYSDVKISSFEIKISIIIILLLQIYWIVKIIPLIQSSYFGVLGFLPFSWCAGGRYANYQIDFHTFYMATHFLLFFLIFFVYTSIMKQKKYISLIILCIVLIYRHLYMPIFYNYDVSHSQYNKIEEEDKFVDSIKEDLNIKDIYVYDKTNLSALLMQFYNMKEKVIPETPKAKTENAIIIAYENINSILNESYYIIKINEKSYIYIHGSKYLKYFKDKGYQITSVEAAK